MGIPVPALYCYDRYLIVPRKSFSLSTRGVDASFTPGYTLFLFIDSRPPPSRILSSSTADLLRFASLPASRAHSRLPFPPVRHHCRPLRISPCLTPERPAGRSLAHSVRVVLRRRRCRIFQTAVPLNPGPLCVQHCLYTRRPSRADLPTQQGVCKRD